MDSPFEVIARHLPKGERIDRAVICVSSRKTKNGARKYVVSAEERCYDWWKDDEMDEACWSMCDYGLTETAVGDIEEFEDEGLCLELRRPSKYTFIISAFWSEEKAEEENPQVAV